MGTYKILLEDSIGYDFTLIALHGTLEPYYIAYLLNKHLNIHLARTSKDLVISKDERSAHYPCFEYKDDYQYIDYYVLVNKARVDTLMTVSEGLFGTNETISTTHFVPEMPQVDYFLKVVEDGYAFAKAKTLKLLNQIPQIVTAYDVNVSQLKTKQNLIFE